MWMCPSDCFIVIVRYTESNAFILNWSKEKGNFSKKKMGFIIIDLVEKNKSWMTEKPFQCLNYLYGKIYFNLKSHKIIYFWMIFVEPITIIISFSEIFCFLMHATMDWKEQRERVKWRNGKSAHSTKKKNVFVWIFWISGRCHVKTTCGRPSRRIAFGPSLSLSLLRSHSHSGPFEMGSVMLLEAQNMNGIVIISFIELRFDCAHNRNENSTLVECTARQKVAAQKGREWNDQQRSMVIYCYWFTSNHNHSARTI